MLPVLNWVEVLILISPSDHELILGDYNVVINYNDITWKASSLHCARAHDSGTKGLLFSIFVYSNFNYAVT